MSRAVVIGGSVAGMCAARVLCDFFDEVVLLDRDHYPADVAARTGEYLRIAMFSAHEDAELRRHLIPIFNLVAPPSLFFEPRLMAKVLLHTAKKELEQRLLGALPIPDAPPR